MKKILAIVALIALVATPAYAGIGDAFDNTVDYVGSREGKTGIIYDFNSKDTQAFLGTAIVSDVLGVENLDLDGLVASNDPLNDDSVVLYGGLSYTVALNETIDVGLGGAAGSKRIESFDELGEFSGGIYGFARW